MGLLPEGGSSLLGVSDMWRGCEVLANNPSGKGGGEGGGTVKCPCKNPGGGGGTAECPAKDKLARDLERDWCKDSIDPCSAGGAYCPFLEEQCCASSNM